MQFGIFVALGSCAGYKRAFLLIDFSGMLNCSSQKKMIIIWTNHSVHVFYFTKKRQLQKSITWTTRHLAYFLNCSGHTEWSTHGSILLILARILPSAYGYIHIANSKSCPIFGFNSGNEPWSEYQTPYLPELVGIFCSNCASFKVTVNAPSVGHNQRWNPSNKQTPLFPGQLRRHPTSGDHPSTFITEAEPWDQLPVSHGPWLVCLDYFKMVF